MDANQSSLSTVTLFYFAAFSRQMAGNFSEAKRQFAGVNQHLSMAQELS
jgi:hypothetical protein